MTNDQRIAEITARCEAATLGPWEWMEKPDECDYLFTAKALCGEDDFVIGVEDAYSGYPECGEDLEIQMSPEDADFIAHAREDIPYLLGQLAERTEECDNLRREVTNLAKESFERVRTLAKLEAEVMVWAKAEQEGRLVVLKKENSK